MPDWSTLLYQKLMMSLTWSIGIKHFVQIVDRQILHI